jgi:hypothetical protein
LTLLAAGALAALGACAADDEGPRVDTEPTRLEFVREWLRPTIDPDTDWFTHPVGIELDSTTGHLFVQDRDWKTVIEVDEEGSFVRTFGKAGEGPGEIGHASALALDERSLYLADNGNLKILIYRRADGALEHEFRIPVFYRDLVPLEDGRILVVPGVDRAVDILDREGEIVGGIGRRSALPGTCTGCAMTRLPDGRVVVLNGDRPELFVFAPETDEPAWWDLTEMPLMASWQAELEAHMRRIARMGGGRFWMWMQIEAVGRREVILNALPPKVTETGLEIWRFDVDTGNTERYDFGLPLIGSVFAVDWPRLIVNQNEDAAILEYRFPDR